MKIRGDSWDVCFKTVVGRASFLGQEGDGGSFGLEVIFSFVRSLGLTERTYRTRSGLAWCDCDSVVVVLVC